jgi:hypothetical protein
MSKSLSDSAGSEAAIIIVCGICGAPCFNQHGF